MQIKPEQIERHLSTELKPVYWVMGEETFLIEESLDAIRLSAKEKGFIERETFYVDAKFDWSRLREETQALSLFATQKMIELRMPQAKLGRNGGAQLKEILSQADEDYVFVIVSEKIDKRTLQSAWAKWIDQVGVLVQHWKVGRAQLPAFLQGRLKREHVTLEREALDVLSFYVEGNLLAAGQEVKRLGLLYRGQTLDAETLKQVLVDHARFDGFSVSEAFLSMGAAMTLRRLEQVQQEGVALPIIVSVLARDVRQLVKVAFLQRQGMAMRQIFSELKIWRNREEQINTAMRRWNLDIGHQALQGLSDVDKTLKGVLPGDEWQALKQWIRTYG